MVGWMCWVVASGLTLAQAAEPVAWDVQASMRLGGLVQQRSTPRVGGLRVLGADRVERLGTSVGSGVLRSASMDGRVDGHHRVDAPDWRAEVLARTGAAVQGEPVVESVWRRRDGGGLTPAHVVRFHAGGGWWEAVVDDRSREWIDLDLLSRHADALVYADNPVRSEPESVTLPRLTSPDRLSGEYADAFSCLDWIIEPGFLGRTECLEWTRFASVDPEVRRELPSAPEAFEDPFAEVNLYFHVDRIAELAVRRYGWRPEGPLRVYANFEMTNAFYGDFDADGEPDLSFGQSESGVDFAYDADVIYHEFGHALNAVVADLPYINGDDLGIDFLGGSLNEGLADVLSMALSSDPLLAEYAGGAVGREAIRDLTELRQCPFHLVGEVHVDGEVLGSAAWAMIDSAGVDPLVVADIFVAASMSWGPDVSWTEVASTLREAADMAWRAQDVSDAQRTAIERIVARTGMDGCERIVPLLEGESHDVFVFHAGLKGDYEIFGGGIQLAVDVPEDATALELSWPELRTGDERLGWAVHLRQDHPVDNTSLSLGSIGIGFARPAVFDREVRGTAADAGTLRLDAESTPPLIPGSTVFVQMSGWDPGELVPLQGASGMATVTATVERDALRGGCSTAPVGLAAWAGLLAFIGTRRRDA